jgi:hypothetical protein
MGDDEFEEELGPGSAIDLSGPVSQFAALDGTEQGTAGEGAAGDDRDAHVPGQRQDSVLRFGFGKGGVDLWFPQSDAI